MQRDEASVRRLQVRRYVRDYDEWVRRAGPFYPRQRRRVQARILEVAGTGEGRHACDAGAGVGALSEGLAEQGWRTHAFDIRVPPRDPGPAYPVTGDLRHPPFARSSLDLVVFLASLQHVADPDGVLSAWAPVLRPGGRLIIGLTPVHRTDKAAGRDQEEARRRIRAHGGIAVAQRYQHFTRSWLTRALGAAGLEARFHSSGLSVGLRAWRAAKGMVVGGDIAAFPIVEAWSAAPGHGDEA